MAASRSISEQQLVSFGGALAVTAPVGALGSDLATSAARLTALRGAAKAGVLQLLALDAAGQLQAVDADHIGRTCWEGRDPIDKPK